MRRIAALTAGMAALAAAGFAAAQPAGKLAASDAPFVAFEQPVLAFTHVVLLDGTGGPAQRDMTIVVSDGRIAAVGPAATTAPPPGAVVVDGAGKTILPGFVLMHEHLFYPNSKGGYGDYPEAFTRLYLASGETTIRTAGSLNPYADLAVARAIRAGRQVGPDVDVSGPYIEGEPKAVARMPAVTGPPTVAKLVDYWTGEGATSWKVYEHISRADLRATVAAAHAHGLKVTGHICSVTYQEAIDAGIDNLEHTFQEASDFVAGKKPDVCPPWPVRLQSLIALDPDGPEAGRLIKSLVDHKVALTSTYAIDETLMAGKPMASAETLAPLSPALRAAYTAAWTQNQKGGLAKLLAAFMPKMARMEHRFVAEGGLLMAGSDPTGFGGVVPGTSAQHQFRMMIEEGFTAPEAIRIMSLNGAVFLGRDKEVGTVALGKRADLVLIDGDLSKTTDAIDHVSTVFKAGVGYDSGAIKAAYAGKVGID